MKVYVTARYKNSIENRENVESLCYAVRNAGMEDFWFTRDVENFQKVFDNPKDLWARALQEIKECDALLIDVSDAPSGGRVVEAGIAYALGQPIFVIVKNGVKNKDVYDGIATEIIKYDDHTDITSSLTRYLDESK